jgi:glycosyltransferase involved in cell wall biosynthesis
VPSLVGRLGGVQEMVEDGRTGFLFDGTDDGLAAALARLATAPWDRAALDAACRDAARAYAPDAIAAEYEAVFEAAAARREAPSGAGVRWSAPPLDGRQGARP